MFDNALHPVTFTPDDTAEAGGVVDNCSEHGGTGIGGNVGRERAGARAAWQLAWHAYRADRGGSHYGHEWNASLSLPLAKGVSGLLKVADYRADRFARDTRKLWLQLDYKGSR